MTEQKNKASFYLLPNLLGQHKHHETFLPAGVDRAVAKLDGLIAESAQGGRSFLNRFQCKKAPHEIPIALYNKNTKEEEIDFLLEPLEKGENWGYVSDAGLPCIADPGSMLVKRARAKGIQVKAFVGPSSLSLALMLSGLPAQRFSFHGYLPREEKEIRDTLKEWEQRSRKEDATQAFIETPYRNKKTLENLLAKLSDQTELCIAWDLTLPTQGVVSHTVATWKKFPHPNLEKKPAVFLFLA